MRSTLVLRGKPVQPELHQPYEPPIQTAELASTGGRIGDAPEDFVVDEQPLYPPSGTGDHLYIRLRKRAWTTPDAVRALTRVAGVTASDAGFAGMKDKHAVTTQWVSIPASSTAPETWQLPHGLEVLELSRHSNKLRTGHLSGNSFRIRLVDVVRPHAAEALVERLRREGLVNYFGSQRFGRGANNLDRALRWVRSPPRPGRRSRFDNKLWPSVLQAEVFNRFAAARVANSEPLLAGDIVRLEGTHSVFLVQDVAAELPRLTARDLHLTGPIFGPKMRHCSGLPGDFEQQAIASLGLSEDQLRTLGRHAKGTRRDLRVMAENLTVHAEPDGTMILSFRLPSGCYATQLVREFTRSPFFSASTLVRDGV